MAVNSHGQARYAQQGAGIEEKEHPIDAIEEGFEVVMHIAALVLCMPVQRAHQSSAGCTKPWRFRSD